YLEEHVIDVTDLVQGMYDAGANYGFVLSTDAVDSWLQFRSSESDEVAYRPSLEIDYIYGDGGIHGPTYGLTVNDGRGGGDYPEGAVLAVDAYEKSGFAFDQWTGDTTHLADAHDPTTTLIMPAADVEITATYVPAASGYTLTVINGNPDGVYAPGWVVRIDAEIRTGYVFDRWVGDTDNVDDVTSWMARLTMPAADVTVTATYLEEAPGQEDLYPAFEQFSIDTFGAEAEPLTYDIFGSDLFFIASGAYEYASETSSETSAFVAFETNLPATTYVEYGPDTGYGSRIDHDARHYYLHQYYLTELDQDTTYHYRIVAEDERGNTVASADQEFTTATPAGAIRLAGGSISSPYVLNQAGATYLLTGDLTADYTAFEITVDNVTLDLGGHTVVYNQVDYQVPGESSLDYTYDAAYGVKCVWRDGARVLNGRIVQGAGENAAQQNSVGYSPVMLRDSAACEVAGITAEYIGTQITGFSLSYSSGADVHHNVILDRGGRMTNRHQGLQAVMMGSSAAAHHNLILRARHRGIFGVSGNEIYANEIYNDSRGTNAFGIFFYEADGALVHDNRLFGTGYALIAIGTVSGCANMDIYGNLIHLQATAPLDIWPEYGAGSQVNGHRITWGADNITFRDNVVSVYARDGGTLRGLWMCTEDDVSGVVYRGNTIQAIAENEASDHLGAVVLHGDYNVGVPVTVFENNRIISNFVNVRIGESYGNGNNTAWYGNTFVKAGPDRPDYVTFAVGFWDKPTVEHYFYDSTFEGGAGYDSTYWEGWGQRDFYVGWTVTILTEAFADVTVRDALGNVVFTGQTDDAGELEVQLLEYKQEPTARTYYTDHEVTVSKAGFDTEILTVTVDQTLTLPIPLS
ncbi:MAG: InlB B-repeat-containing protein, partial [Planctomycetota bacterium]